MKHKHHVASAAALKLTIFPTALTGILYPSEGQISKQQGRRVTKFGPLESWRINIMADSYEVI